MNGEGGGGGESISLLLRLVLLKKCVSAPSEFWRWGRGQTVLLGDGVTGILKPEILPEWVTKCVENLPESLIQGGKVS